MVIHLFTGIINGVENYVDDPMEVLHRKLTSLSGFWFDFVTSLPWSYLDLHAYWVPPRPSVPYASHPFAAPLDTRGSCRGAVLLLRLGRGSA
jgi:hypothetical protein